MNLFFDLGGAGTPELCLRKSDPWVTKPLKTRNTQKMWVMTRAHAPGYSLSSLRDLCRYQCRSGERGLGERGSAGNLENSPGFVSQVVGLGLHSDARLPRQVHA